MLFHRLSSTLNVMERHCFTACAAIFAHLLFSFSFLFCCFFLCFFLRLLPHRNTGHGHPVPLDFRRVPFSAFGTWLVFFICLKILIAARLGVSVGQIFARLYAVEIELDNKSARVEVNKSSAYRNIGPMTAVDKLGHLTTGGFYSWLRWRKSRYGPVWSAREESPKTLNWTLSPSHAVVEARDDRHEFDL